MKKWNKPQINGLDIINTYTSDCECNLGVEVSTYKPSKHPCHKTGNGEHNDNGNSHESSGHPISVGCTVHELCCCYKPGDPTPGLS